VAQVANCKVFISRELGHGNSCPFPLFTLSYTFDDDVLHVLIVAMSFLVLVISALAYVRRPSRRYLFLLIAFVFLALSQSETLIETIFLSNALVIVPVLNVHLSHLFDFFMVFSFGLALLAR
jgi:hypothetical protein